MQDWLARLLADRSSKEFESSMPDEAGHLLSPNVQDRNLGMQEIPDSNGLALAEANLSPPKPEPTANLDGLLKMASMNRQSRKSVAPAIAPNPPSTEAQVSSVPVAKPQMPNDDELTKAMATRDSDLRNANLSRASDKILSGFASTRGGKVDLDEAGFKGMVDQANQKVTDVKTKKEDQAQSLKNQKELGELDDLAALQDPNSAISKALKEGAAMYGISVPPGLSGKQLKDSGINLGTLLIAKQNAEAKVEAAKLNAETRKALNEDRKFTRNESLQLRKDAEARKEQDKLDKDVDKYSTKLDKSGAPQANVTLQKIDRLMEGLDSNKKDLPGYGLVAGLLPDLLAGSDGRELRQAVQRLANIELKDRSGSAVTIPEYERFKKEFGNGTFTTEAQLRNGLRMYRDALKGVIEQHRAGASKEAIKEYEGRAGALSPEALPGKANKVKSPASVESNHSEAVDWAKANLANPKNAEKAKRILQLNGIEM